MIWKQSLLKYCKSKGCEQAYPAIVASGLHFACILHYTKITLTLNLINLG